jgi:hypothetical protein
LTICSATLLLGAEEATGIADEEILRELQDLDYSRNCETVLPCAVASSGMDRGFCD